jgi:hypothetical protein
VLVFVLGIEAHFFHEERKCPKSFLKISLTITKWTLFSSPSLLIGSFNKYSFSYNLVIGQVEQWLHVWVQKSDKIELNPSIATITLSDLRQGNFLTKFLLLFLQNGIIPATHL